MGRSSHILERVFVAAALSTALSQTAVAACYAPDKQMSPQAVSDFMSNPSSLLGKSGDGLKQAVQDLVDSNPATLPLVIDQLKTASTAQQGDIGTGLGWAQNACNVPDPTFAATIAAELAKATSTPAQTQFALATGQPIGAVGGGGGGAGGVSSGGVGGSTNPSTTATNGTPSGTPFTSNATPTTSTNLFTGGVTGASAANTTTTAAATAASSTSR